MRDEADRIEQARRLRVQLPGPEQRQQAVQTAMGFFGSPKRRWPWSDGEAIALARLSHADDQGHTSIDENRLRSLIYFEPCLWCDGSRPDTCLRCRVALRYHATVPGFS